MKTLKLFFTVLLLTGVAGCYNNGRLIGPNNNIPASGTFSNANAAALIAGALAVSSDGVAVVSSNITFTSRAMVNQQLACGATQKDTVNEVSPKGATNTYNYHSTYSYTLNCNSSNQPDNTSTNYVYAGSYTNASYSSTNSGSSIFTTSGLSSTSNLYVVNGEFKQSGSFQSTTNTANAGNHSIDIVLQNLTFNKTSMLIASGTATLSVTGTQPGSGAFSYTGNLVFNGNGSASLTLNGVNYTINLNTGVVTKV